MPVFVNNFEYKGLMEVQKAPYILVYGSYHMREDVASFQAALIL